MDELEKYRGRVSVRMLGEFSIAVDGKTVSEQLRRSKKLRGVVQYLLLNADRPVPHTELYETFWPGESSQNPRAALKTLMHRLRAALVQGGAPDDLPFFLVQQGSYQWNLGLKAQMDIETFEAACQRLHGGGLAREERLELLRTAASLYRGRFLDSSEIWMLPPAAHLHGQYLSVVGELCGLLQEDEQYDEIIAVCREALQIDELDEAANYALILALTACGRTQEAMAQYSRITDLYYDDMGVQVSDELRALYRKIAEVEQATELDIDGVRGKLEEREAQGGAYVCEYGIFEDIYRIEARCLARYGGRMFLALLTVTDAYCQMPEQRVLGKAMERLLEASCASLRRCDVIARYSPSQYVLLLPTVTYETGQMVLERIRRAFRRLYPKAPVVISGKLRPLRPCEEQTENELEE
ncbi:BTAD domain-containing putative transcriptional regulator [Agathobaculum sp.]|uniref:BTAD domain-containing putative transcriptional regulator n=1 Tax=Agathobaculum sp. TaxID=2048138 RepID=UPI002A82C6B1|nr:BTAD domain-containing putative transcriptional regulator [Agathobaculum sp.]MDY3617824.1 BTAD domain-containing putative transcriptional regulator [Agathobaculum sp.]